MITFLLLSWYPALYWTDVIIYMKNINNLKEAENDLLCNIYSNSSI